LEPATPGHEIRVVGSKHLVVASMALLLPLAACGTSHRGSDAGAVVERFHAELRSGDGAGACHELSKETVSKLEQQEGKPCAKAIIGVELPKGGTAVVKRVEITSAYVRLDQGSADFLDEGPDGWRISAAGCKPSGGDKPYECEVEG
jgi:hypothetical protein